MHPSTIYGHIIINFDVDMAMTLVIWLETQACSYMVGHIVKQVFSKVVKTHVYHFSWQLVHVRGRHAQVLHFLFFFIFFDFFFSKLGQICLHANSLQEVESLKTLGGFRYIGYLGTLKLFLAKFKSNLSRTCSSNLTQFQ